jgi:hypothetical protein
MSSTPRELSKWDPVGDAMASLEAVTSDLPKQAIGELPLSQDLLEYYRKRIEDFEREREDMLSRISDIEVSRKESHQLQWEHHKLEKEVEELQRALSDAHVYLFDEREKVLKLHAENSQLKIQEMEDRQRIQALLALAKPAGEEVTYFRDCRPAHVRQDLKADDSIASVKRGPGVVANPRILKTVRHVPARLGSARGVRA